MRTTSITLGERYTKFTSAQVESGRYGSVSEVIREGLRILEEREMKLEALRAAAAKGLSSGRSNKTYQEVFASLIGA